MINHDKALRSVIPAAPKGSQYHYPTFYFHQIQIMRDMNYEIPYDVKTKYLRSLAAYPEEAKKYGLDESFLNGKCFSGDVLVRTGLLTSKPISEIRVGDFVLSFSPSADFGRGALVPRRVTRLFGNVTTEWVVLYWQEDGESCELTCTPGHHFLDEFGNYPTIAEILGCVDKSWHPDHRGREIEEGFV